MQSPRLPPWHSPRGGLGSTRRAPGSRFTPNRRQSAARAQGAGAPKTRRLWSAAPTSRVRASAPKRRECTPFLGTSVNSWTTDQSCLTPYTRASAVKRGRVAGQWHCQIVSCKQVWFGVAKQAPPHSRRPRDQGATAEEGATQPAQRCTAQGRAQHSTGTAQRCATTQQPKHVLNLLDQSAQSVKLPTRASHAQVEARVVESDGGGGRRPLARPVGRQALEVAQLAQVPQLDAVGGAGGHVVAVL